MRATFSDGGLHLAVDRAVPGVNFAHCSYQFLVGVAVLGLEELPQTGACEFERLDPGLKGHDCPFGGDLSIASSVCERSGGAESSTCPEHP